MRQAVLITDHAPVHEEVLVAAAGERVRLGREDAEWPGWIWCVSAAGVGSWTPEPYLAREGAYARLLVDYEATELTAAAGERVTLDHEVNGWWWAANERGDRGWVPEGKLRHIPDRP